MSSFYVDRKYTIWQRAYFEGDKEEIIKLLKEGKSDEIYDPELGFIYNETLFETEEEMIPEENDNQATIGVYEEGKEGPIFTNGK